MDEGLLATDISVMTHPQMAPELSPIGRHLRRWRERRRMSQLDLALEAEISARHLSFVETGRSRPSREMVLLLAERLDVPLREQNTLLVAAGFAPVFQERSLADSTLASVRQAVELVLAGHAPYPALAVDRHWTLVSANDAAAALMADVDPALLVPPVNVLRLSLHQAGLASRIVNLTEWRAHVLELLRRQIHATADPTLIALRDELAGYAPRRFSPSAHSDAAAAPAVVLRIASGQGILDFITTTTVFGAPVDVTLSELAIESFFPANTATATALGRMAEKAGLRPAGSLPSGSVVGQRDAANPVE
jgi:transcriptional regulator with XRE-family HTH domain